MENSYSVVVVIPCYRTGPKVLDVIARIPAVVDRIIVVDDACPDSTGDLVENESADQRVEVIRLDENLGVGGATMVGYKAALTTAPDVVVKIDGDGQMNPALLPGLIQPILLHRADYVKGNRFFQPEFLSEMPLIRRIGNAGLSFLTKLSSGYWHIMDPTNGFTAIHGTVLALLPFDKVEPRFFFESDMLFRLGTLDAVIADAPMRPVYAGENSNLNPVASMNEFLVKNIRNTYKRILYSYFLRGFSVASVELLVGLLLILLGIAIGVPAWVGSIRSNVPATAGTVMLAGLPIFLGTQLVLGFLSADLGRRQDIPLHLRISSLLTPQEWEE
ncbi:MAG: glycosyltransferase family 2 protein [Acidimicrobiia bacterium]